MHHTEITRIIKALGDPSDRKIFTIFALDGIWMIQDESGEQPLSDWLKKISLHDRLCFIIYGH
jgi:hypothetical protein